MDTFRPWETRIAELENETGERITLDTGSYGYSSWHWGALEALRDVYAYVFPLSHETSEDWRAVDSYVQSCEDIHATTSIEEQAELSEFAHWGADVLMDRLNDSLPAGFVFDFYDGALYLFIMCEDEDCNREDCAVCGGF